MAEIVITENDDYPEPPPGYGKGYARDYSRHPFGYSAVAKAWDAPLIPESEWAGRLEQQKAARARLSDIRNRGKNGQQIPALDQAQEPYCWAHGPVSAVLLARAFANLPFVDLSAYAVACKVANFQSRGGWGIEAMEFMAENGCPSSEFWPQRSKSRSNDNEQTWANARLHVPVEWMELEPRNKAQMVTALLSGWPICVGYDHWGHEVCLMDIVSLSPLRVKLLNSWGEWNGDGTGILEGERALGDGWECIRVISPSVS